MRREMQADKRFSEAFDRLPLNIQQCLLVVGDIIRRMSPKEVAISGKDGLVCTPSKTCDKGGNHED